MQWVTVFHGSRDGYQVPLALEEAGQLEALVTDWYTPADRRWFKAMVPILPAKMLMHLMRRYCDGLPSARVRAHAFVAGKRRWFHAGLADVAASLGARAADVAMARASGILAYSYYAHAVFPAYSGSAPRVLFQVHPHPASLRAMFLDEMQRVPLCHESLSAELEIKLSQPQFDALCAEAELADSCLVASHYTKRTLVSYGIAPERIRVIPYGVDTQRFSPPPAPPEGRFRVLFVGQMAQRKGLAYLLEAWRRLSLPDADLILCGRGIRDDALLTEYAGLYQLNWAVSTASLVNLYQSSDIMCLPSLAEGFGLVYLESLACGTPIIGTDNTGAADVIDDGKQGFVIPIRDVDALMDRLLWGYHHRSELRAMRSEARALAEQYPWSRFRNSLVTALNECEGESCRPMCSAAKD